MARKKLAKNVYMGIRSLARVDVNGKVDTFDEVMKNLYATAYDSLNLILLDNDPPGLLVNERLFINYYDWDYTTYILSLFKVVNERTFINTLKGRFLILRRLASKIREKTKRAYALTKIEQIEQLTFNLLQRFQNPLLSGADSILKNDMLDVLDISEMDEIDALIINAERRLIKLMAQGKIKTKK